MKAFLVAVVAISCFAGVFAGTACEEHREREQKSSTKVKLIPKCTSEGDYEALQCFEGSRFCMCWRADGSHIVDPSLKIKTCACHVHRDNELQRSSKGLVGNFVPQCNHDGTYASKQCHGSTGYCWCADETGKRTSDSVRGDPNC